jgi:hypothetical protein
MPRGLTPMSSCNLKDSIRGRQSLGLEVIHLQTAQRRPAELAPGKRCRQAWQWRLKGCVWGAVQPSGGWAASPQGQAPR